MEKHVKIKRNAQILNYLIQRKHGKDYYKKPQFKGFKIFSDNLAAIDLRKVQAKIDKPFYVGFSVLELSKLHMYKFHYRYIKKKFVAKAKLLFTDKTR